MPFLEIKLSLHPFYVCVSSGIKAIVEGPPHQLLESVANQIAAETLKKHDKIYAIRVCIKKPHVAVEGVLDYLGMHGTAPCFS